MKGTSGGGYLQKAGPFKKKSKALEVIKGKKVLKRENSGYNEDFFLT